MCEIADDRTKMDNIIEEAERKLNDISEDTEDKGFLRNAVQQAIGRLRQLQGLLESKEYTLVFMGKPGCGKTATITSLCNLATEKIKDVEKNPISKTKASILPVGSGGTTMQENTEIIKSDTGNYIEVQCCGRDTLIEIVRDVVEKNYCLELKSYIPGNQKIEFEHADVPHEIERYIEGMCKTKELGLLIKEKSRQLIESGSEGDILREERIFGNVDEIVDYIMSELIFLDSRCSETGDYEIRFEIDDSDLKNDLKNKMSEINDGKMEGLSIIHSVKIYLKDTDFFPANEKYTINKIVDTRGYRGSKDGKTGEKVREDYQKYLCNDAVNTICIFETNYKDCSGGNSSDISEIIKYNVNASYRNGLNAILINWQTGEVYDNRDNAEYDEEDDSDERESEEVLVGNRIKQMQEYYDSHSMDDTKLNLNSSNIFAYNAMAGYELVKRPGEGEVITRYNSEEAEICRNRMLKDIFTMIDRERENVKRTISENYNILRMFIDYGKIDGDDVKEEIIGKLKEASERFIQLVCRELDQIEFYKLYYEKLNSFHSRAYKPLAMHSGEYRGYELISVFHIDNEMYEFYLRHIHRLNKLLEEELDSVNKKLEGIKNAEEILRILENIKETMIDRLDAYANEIKDLFKNIINDSRYFSKASEVWNRAKGRAVEGGKGVNADIRKILLESIDPAEEEESLYGCFRDRFGEIQANINKRLQDIVDESFGTKSNRDDIDTVGTY